MSEEAYRRLTERAKHEGLTKTRLLERTIEIGIQKHSTHTASTNEHHWPPPTGEPRRRRANTGTRELRLWIGSTAWRKVEAEADARGESKSRVIDRLLRTHQWLTPAAKQRNEDYRERLRAEAEAYENRTITPPTPEQVEDYQRRVREFNELQADRQTCWKQLTQSLVAAYLKRHPEI